MKKVMSLLLAVLLVSLCGCIDVPDVSEGNGDTTTTTTAVPVAAPLTMTVVEDIPVGAQVYTDPTVDLCNYTLKFTANEELTNLRVMTVSGVTDLFEETLYTLPALGKGESVYVRTYINDAAPIRGIAVTDKQGETHYYRPVFSGKDGSITLKKQDSRQ